MPTADTSSHPGVDFLRAICFSSSIDISVLLIRVLRFHVIAAQQLVATVSLRNRLYKKSGIFRPIDTPLFATTQKSLSGSAGLNRLHHAGHSQDVYYPFPRV